MPAQVLFVSHSAELNGAERWLLEIMTALDKRAFAPSLVVPRPGPLPAGAEAAGIPAAVVPMKWSLSSPGRSLGQPAAWLWNVPAVLGLKRLIAGRGIDLVCSNSAAAAPGALAAKLAGRPHVWVIHEILAGRRPLLRFVAGNRILVRLILGLSQRVVVNSLASGRAFGTTPKVEIVHGAAGLPRRRGIRAAAGWRRSLGLRSGEKVVGVVGRLVPDKGQAEVIEALALARGAVKGLKAVFVGAAADGRYFGRLRAAARRLGVEDDVRFAGAVPDVFDVLPLMNLLVSASRVESFGRTVVEAQAAGVPVLAVRTGGIPEIVGHGETGYLVESNRPADLAVGLAEFFARKPSDVARVVRRARKSALERFRPDVQVRGLERVFASVLRESGHAR
jgi:glycosyltransferase involved in cell wall biosynthesis